MGQSVVGTPVAQGGGCSVYTRRQDDGTGAEEAPESWFLKSGKSFAEGMNVCVFISGLGIEKVFFNEHDNS